MNQLWVADITYLRLGREFVFLAVVLDVYSRKAIGWALVLIILIIATLQVLLTKTGDEN